MNERHGRLEGVSLPECVLIWESQRVQEGPVQQHELVVDPTGLQGSENRQKKLCVCMHVCLHACVYVTHNKELLRLICKV